VNILFYEWGSYTAGDVASAFKEAGISTDIYQYILTDKNEDERFENELESKIKNSSYDAVFSVNYFPVIAKVCHKNNIKYISWSYDNPLNVINIEETLGLSTNYVFLFDKVQASKYQGLGFDNVYHLPLAVSVQRLNGIQLSSVDKARYMSDISFVGNLYNSMLGAYINPLEEYQRGYIDGICTAQSHVYGYYMVDDMLTDAFMDEINQTYKKVKPDTEFVLPREALSYAMAAEITRKERLSILGLLSAHHDVSLYSRDKIDGLADIKQKGAVDYSSEMPKVFKCSKVNMNITLKILQSGIPLRVLDIMGCGGFVLSNYQPEVAEYFVNGEEIAMYDSVEDAYAQADYYLAHDDIRCDIARRGLEKVSREFSYRDRVNDMLRISGLS